MENLPLDTHCTMILEEYQEKQDVFKTMKEIILQNLHKCLEQNNIAVTAIEARIKTEKSLVGKLARKGSKYRSLADLTDIVGARIITFYTNEVDKIAALMESLFTVDWKNSVDKRKSHKINSFGYLSLHYICSIPKSLYYDEKMPEINEYRFEIQMRSALQHVWSTIEHDIGYKSDIEIPNEYLRTLSRLAGVLELVDDEFSRLRSSLTAYRYKVDRLLKNRDFDNIPLDGESFGKYLELEPFKRLTDKIAAINQAEIHPTPLMPFLRVLLKMGFTNLGEIERLIRDYSADAYQLALHQIGGTDLDIIASNIGIQNLCLVYQLKNGIGQYELTQFFDALYGESSYNAERASKLLEDICHLPFMIKTEN